MASEIEKLREWEDGDSVYRTSCECMGDDHMTIGVNVDKQDATVFLDLWVDVNHSTHVWDAPKWNRGLRDFWNRLKSCWKLLTSGYLEYNTGFIFRGEAHMDEFCATIQEAKERAIRVAQEKGYGKQK